MKWMDKCQTIKHKCNQPHLIIQSLAVPTSICTIAEWRETDSSATWFQHNPPEPDMKVQKKGIKMCYQSWYPTYNGSETVILLEKWQTLVAKVECCLKVTRWYRKPASCPCHHHHVRNIFYKIFAKHFMHLQLWWKHNNDFKLFVINTVKICS
jgi:hypothetical protein